MGNACSCTKADVHVPNAKPGSGSKDDSDVDRNMYATALEAVARVVIASHVGVHCPASMQDDGERLRSELKHLFPSKLVVTPERMETLLGEALTKMESCKARAQAAGCYYSSSAQQGAAAANGARPPLADKLEDGNFTAGKMWQNWGRSLAYEPAVAFHEPATAEEVAAIVKAARVVRCVGHGHSWTPVFFEASDQATVIFSRSISIYGAPPGTYIQLVRRAQAGQGAHVKVAAGVTTGRLATWFEENADAIGHTGFGSDVILNSVRYAGVISTACHGVGKDVRTVPDTVVAVTLVDAQGQIRQYDSSYPYWNELRASFGLAGVIIDITFELDANLDRPYVRVQHEFPRMRELFGLERSAGCAKLKDMVMRNVAVEMFWFPMNSMSFKDIADFLSDDYLTNWKPYSDRMWHNLFTERVSRSEVSELARYSEEPGPGLAREVLETKLGAALASVAQRSGKLRLQALSGSLSGLIRAEAAWGYLKSGIKTLPKAIHYKQAIDLFECYDFEVCFPVAEDFGNVFDAWNVVVRITEDTIRTKKRNPLNVALEMRFTKGSDILMSPAYVPPVGNRDQLFCWIEMLGGSDTPLESSWLPFVKQVFEAWCTISHPGGAMPKPHWAKWNDINQAKKITGGGSQAAKPQQPGPPATNGASMPAVGVDYLTPYVQKVYAQQLAVFRQAARSWDPDGKFRNKWLEDTFGL